MREEFVEKIYAGWLAKIIGIRLGAPIEGWTYEQIKNVFGEVNHYPVEYHDFAADDDSNGPIFFLRALEDSNHGIDMQAQDVAEALLNYAPYEHGFFWWGGYGTATEHTAYLNLRSGIPAPRSGSIAQNGATMAEQIGGQIFIDTWGLVAPGNPDLAARLAKEAASVTHDGNGIYGGIFIAVCISLAFVEKDIKEILKKGLSYIPEDSEYVRVVKAVMVFHEEHPESWEDCYKFIFENFGYDKYPGNCHIIPNTAVMILGLLYGNGDFSDTLNITNMCGWDTDCNVGNIATIMGVLCGLEGIDYDKWRKPINDFLACSSVIGSLNIMDIPYGAIYIAKLAYALAGEKMPEPWRSIGEERIDSCHFEYPGSTHAIRVRVGKKENENSIRENYVMNTDEAAATGKRSLKFVAQRASKGENIYVYKKTYYVPDDFHDSRYDPSFSPTIYPGQRLHGSVSLPEYGFDGLISLYVRDAHTGNIYESECYELKKGQWKELVFDIPALPGTLLDEAGFCFHVKAVGEPKGYYTALIDDLYVDGNPEYTLEFQNEREEVWPGLHREISQMTRLKGIMYLEDGQLHLSCSDFAECYTGRHDWKDYTSEFYFTPCTGEHHMVNFRVQGAIRSYAFGLLPNGKAALLKNQNGYKILKEIPFVWELGEEYCVKISVKGTWLKAEIGGYVLEVQDLENPYLQGSVGMSVQKGSHCRYKNIKIGQIK